MAGGSKVSLDNLENMELIDEENMPNDLLLLSVSELDEEEYVNRLLSIVSSLDVDPSFEDLNCFQSQLYLQHTPTEVIDVFDSQDSNLAIDDGYFYTDLSDEDVGSLLPDDKKHSTPANTDADSNSMNSDDNYVASVDVFLFRSSLFLFPRTLIQK
nr:hypothetical protein [Tanacetum cinerariifolium]